MFSNWLREDEGWMVYQNGWEFMEECKAIEYFFRITDDYQLD